MAVLPLLLALACAGDTTVPLEAATPPAVPEGATPPADAAPAEAPAGDATEALMLPTPFTAAQIRDAWQPGLIIRFENTGADQATSIAVWTVVSRSETEGTTLFSTFQADGTTPMEAAAESTSTWEELQNHADFPAAHATRQAIPLDTAMGVMPGIRYVVEDPGEPGMSQVFEFAEAFPGPPVLLQIKAGDQVIKQMKMIERTPPAAEEAPAE